MKKFGVCLFLFAVIAHAKSPLLVWQKLSTNGAREVTPFTINGKHFLAVAQLAKDIANTKANMNGGDSDVPVLVYQLTNGQYQLYQKIPSHGNEGVRFLKMNDSAFLAAASIRSGSNMKYNMHTYSKLYRFDGKFFYPIQQFKGFASKQFYPFSFAGHNYLALANGITSDSANTNSMIYRFNGKRFTPFQEITSTWGYSWEFFEMGGEFYLAFADHIKQSTLYRFDGKQFTPFHVFVGDGGRSFKHFVIDGKDYLAYANIKTDSKLYHFDGRKLVVHQIFEGAGGRNFSYFTKNGKHYLLRINFITGGREKPQTVQQSPLYQWNGKRFEQVSAITTYGGVSAEAYTLGKELLIAVANSLSAKVRFKVDSVIYKVM